MASFEKGSVLDVCGGGQATVLDDGPLGQGGQGEVYRVELDGKEYALKWYTNGDILGNYEFRENLRCNVNKGSIGGSFVWPLFMVEDDDGGFGYIMDLIPSNYVSMVDILNRCRRRTSEDGRSVIKVLVGFPSMEVQLTAAVNVVNSFKLLHRSGMCYKDLNDGGLYFDTATGDVLICDCDNVAPSGEGTSIGKPGYMAPELVNHTGRSSMDTDKHSLAVILFKLLFRDDPLKGKRVYEKVTLTGSVELDAYGDNPLFMMDPDDRSNGPVRGINDNVIRFWSLYPDYVRGEFERTFGPGLKDPSQRTIPNTWFKVMSRLLTECVSCTCGRPTRFLNMEGQDGSIYRCPRCGQEWPIFEVGGLDMVMCKGARIRAYQTETGDRSRGDEDSPAVTGEVVENKKSTGVYGVKNLSDGTWVAKYGDSRRKEISNGQGTVLTQDLVLEFGHGRRAFSR